MSKHHFFWPCPKSCIFIQHFLNKNSTILCTAWKKHWLITLICVKKYPISMHDLVLIRRHNSEEAPPMCKIYMFSRTSNMSLVWLCCGEAIRKQAATALWVSLFRLKKGQRCGCLIEFHRNSLVHRFVWRVRNRWRESTFRSGIIVARGCQRSRKFLIRSIGHSCKLFWQGFSLFRVPAPRTKRPRGGIALCWTSKTKSFWEEKNRMMPNSSQ